LQTHVHRILYTQLCVLLEYFFYNVLSFKEGHILSVFGLWKESLNSLKGATTSSNCTQKKSMSCLVGVNLVNGIATYYVFIIKMILYNNHVNIDMYWLVSFIMFYSIQLSTLSISWVTWWVLSVINNQSSDRQQHMV
jgi:hypothetical protein